jgi:hypothetical protein
MRKLLAALLLAPTLASAQVLYTPNNGGGEIVLTSRPCVYKDKNYEHLREAYTWTNTVGKLDGCWTITDGNVHVIYFVDGNVKVYPLANFKRRD